MDSPTLPEEEALARLEAALRDRPGAGNLIMQKFIADPPATVGAADLRLALSLIEERGRRIAELEAELKPHRDEAERLHRLIGDPTKGFGMRFNPSTGLMEPWEP